MNTHQDIMPKNIALPHVSKIILAQDTGSLRVTAGIKYGELRMPKKIIHVFEHVDVGVH